MKMFYSDKLKFLLMQKIEIIQFKSWPLQITIIMKFMNEMYTNFERLPVKYCLTNKIGIFMCLLSHLSSCPRKSANR